MKISEYQENVKKTASSQQPALAHWYLGLLGELQESIAARRYSINPDEIIIEIGDVFWYIAMMCNELEVDLTVFFASRWDDYTPSIPLPFLLGDALIYATEMSENVKKFCYYEKADKDAHSAAIQHHLWHVAGRLFAYIELSGMILGELLDRNIAKLAERHGEKFNG